MSYLHKKLVLTTTLIKAVEEARKLTQAGAAVEVGRLEIVLRPWRGSAALLAVNNNYTRVSYTNPSRLILLRPDNLLF